MDCVRRINLKTDCRDRQELIDFCLNKEGQQYVAIGWSYVYGGNSNQFEDYKSFYYEVEKSIRENGKRMNHALNSFWYIKRDDLFWTRDMQGFYWICRALDVAQPYYSENMDIGAVVPVKAYQFGMEVPGQIKASFNRPNGGVVEEIRDTLIINYSKHVFNDLSGEKTYDDIEKIEGSIINNLPDFDLEELVISYLQIKEGYYVLSNSIANKSTTVRIECELLSRDIMNPKKAVLQVKAREGYINYIDYDVYIEKGYKVYFYDGGREDNDTKDGCVVISKQILEEFYTDYKKILPESITKWENLFE